MTRWYVHNIKLNLRSSNMPQPTIFLMSLSDVQFVVEGHDVSYLVETNSSIVSYKSSPHPDQGTAPEFKSDSRTSFPNFIRMYNSMAMNACTSLLENIAVMSKLKVTAPSPELLMAFILDYGW